MRHSFGPSEQTAFGARYHSQTETFKPGTIAHERDRDECHTVTIHASRSISFSLMSSLIVSRSPSAWLGLSGVWVVPWSIEPVETSVPVSCTGAPSSPAVELSWS